MSQKEVAVISQNLQTQRKEQNSLLDYIQNNDELEIVKAVENSVIIKKSESSKEELINVVVRWRMYIGVPKTDVAEELVLVAAFIWENYGFLTISEIELAYKLSILNKLSNIEFYGQFAPMYVAKVLDSYLYYRKMTLADSIRRREKALQQEAEKRNRPTPEVMAEDWKKMVYEYYDEWKEKGEIRDAFSLLYNYLRKWKMMEVTKETIEEAQAYGKKKVAELKEKEFFGKIDSHLYATQEKGFSRNYCVQRNMTWLLRLSLKKRIRIRLCQLLSLLKGIGKIKP
jgi:hypothetical protein